MNKEPKWVKVVVERNAEEPFIIPFEAILILWNRKDLLGMYLCFTFMDRIKADFVFSQPKMAQLMNLSYKFYLIKRRELEELGLIETTIERNNFTTITVKTNRLWGLEKRLRGSSEKVKTPLEFKTFEELLDFTNNTGNLLSQELKKSSKEDEENEVLHNIYIYNTSSSNNKNNIISNNNISNKKNTYPKEDYDIVLNAFKKYKGVGLIGPEVSYHMRAIKMMFQAERKPKEIIDFMKWLHDNQNNEETRWVRNWTIWTVQKKLPEFVAGKLESSTGEEELERL